MSDVYTEEELKGMSRVQLRRAALAVLNIDNKEASNSKSGDLISRILESQEGGGGSSNGKSKASKASSAAKPSGRGRAAARARSKPADEEPPAEDEAPSAGSVDLSGIIKRIDAVGKTLDESSGEAKDLLEEINGGVAEIQRQQYILFGLVSDIYKAHYEPDEYEERCSELDTEWENQGNGDSGD